MLQNKWIRLTLILLAAMVAAVAGYFYLLQLSQPTPFIPISKLGQDVQAGIVKQIAIDGTTVNILYTDGTSAKSVKAAGDGGVEITLNNLGVAPARMAEVEITYDQPSPWSNMLALLIGFVPLLFIGAFLFFFMRRAQGGNNQTLA